MRFHTLAILVALDATAGIRAAAQSATTPGQPEMIPTVVAEALSLENAMFGKPLYFNGRTPTDWPDSLVPKGARIIGGGVLGMRGVMRVQAAVFQFERGSDPDRVIRDLFASMGYRAAEDLPAEPVAGFASTSAPQKPSGKYCKGASFAAFATVDSVRDPLTIAIDIVDGQAALSTCNGRHDPMSMMDRHFPVTLPALVPPAGSQAIDGGSTWSGQAGEVTSILMSAMRTDSVLAHYSRQLVAAGWKLSGKGVAAEGVGIQRFAFTQGAQKWNGLLMVVSDKDRHDLTIRFTRVE
jgi:hypothetical protein